MLCRKKCSLIIIIFLLTFLALSFYCADRLQAEPEAGPEVSQETLAVMLVIDVSGSMRYTDPQMLRETAARIFIDLLSPEDYLGAIAFDHDAAVVVPLQRLGSTSEKEHIKNILSPGLQPRGNTDVLKALETAYAQFQEAGVAGARPAVVLLTDGEPDPNPARRQAEPAFMASYMESLWGKVSDFALEGYPIYTVGLGEEIDPEIISRLSIDTKGDYYLLQDPGELLVSFFELLGNLKNRRNLLETTYDLNVGAPQSFEFNVDEHTRQINLVAVNLSGGSCGLSLVPPQGKGKGEGEGKNEGESIEGVTINNSDNYSLAVLSGQPREYRGSWKAVFSGNGEVRALGSMDLSLKAWLEEPQPSSQHPANEPVHFKVKLTGGEYLKDIPPGVEVQVIKPGSNEETIVPLAVKDGYYTGTYEGADREGTYGLLLRLLLDGETVSTVSSRLYVRVLPSLTADFWTEGGYRLGEETIVTGSMSIGGKRLAEGSDFKVGRFSLQLDYDSGEGASLQLFDDGKQEHGDIRQGDGIWSNRLTLNDQGSAAASLLAVGEYRGTEFFLEKNLGTVDVYPPGKVFLELSGDRQWTSSGKDLAFPLKITNDSPFQETLIWEQRCETGTFGLSKILLEPGASKTVPLNFSARSGLETGLYSFPVVFTVENSLTVIEPSSLEFGLEILTPGEAFLRNFYRYMLLALQAAAVIIISGAIFYAGGLLLYRILVHPRKKVNGVLLYSRNGSEPGEKLPQKIRIGKKRKDTVIISLNPDNKNADYCLEGNNCNYDIVIKKVWENNCQPFIQGWEALLHRSSLPLRLILECTAPGIIESEGEIFTRKELFHSDEFASGEFSFQYINPYGKWYRDKKTDGANVLEGRI